MAGDADAARASVSHRVAVSERQQLAPCSLSARAAVELEVARRTQATSRLACCQRLARSRAPRCGASSVGALHDDQLGDASSARPAAIRRERARPKSPSNAARARRAPPRPRPPAPPRAIAAKASPVRMDRSSAASRPSAAATHAIGDEMRERGHDRQRAAGARS